MLTEEMLDFVEWDLLVAVEMELDLGLQANELERNAKKYSYRKVRKALNNL